MYWDVKSEYFVALLLIVSIKLHDLFWYNMSYTLLAASPRRCGVPVASRLRLGIFNKVVKFFFVYIECDFCNDLLSSPKHVAIQHIRVFNTRCK